ncbi:EAL domain-containing protein [Paracraurococcus lichenis]|uniref:EAL domain-containing protein n=1 Tax=Paracraurococcus lichenis TaxID=3064888 RepID=A0ABT9E5F6_9PROT|nr:EAL domain-containing protein [Paracraurococcus sp. LOR1-02]MDO9711399.1 EAL domain-containing protein [Paracraurococcus sp. LOR1-02]
MNQDQDPTVAPTIEAAAEPGPQPSERRRPGRGDAVNPHLIPLLRGEAGRSACGACREGATVFPFSVAFQPVVDLQENRIDAYEALVRGPDGEGAQHVLTQVTPANRYAFDQACRVKAIELAARLGIDRQLNINFLPNAVYEPRACIQTTLRTAARTGLPLHRLTFEIVESEEIVNTPHLLGIIAEYRRHGFRVALDDFGTAHSGLARLVQLRPDIVKLDRILVQDCDTDRTRLAVVAGLLRIGAEIGVKMVLEGVETAGEVAALAAAGARYMQGFYFARPAFEHAAAEAEIRWPVPVPA